MSVSSWFAVYTHAQSEEKALRNLENQGFAAYLPRFLKLRRHARKREWVSAPLFPRYLFVCVDPLRTQWRAINSTFGVDKVVGVSNTPYLVPTNVIDGIRAREAENGFVDLEAERPLKSGDRVQIMDGPFNDLIGLFECKTGEERVIVLLNLLGRVARVCVPRDSVVAWA